MKLICLFNELIVMTEIKYINGFVKERNDRKNILTVICQQILGFKITYHKPLLYKFQGPFLKKNPLQVRCTLSPQLRIQLCIYTVCLSYLQAMLGTLYCRCNSVFSVLLLRQLLKIPTHQGRTALSCTVPQNLTYILQCFKTDDFN